MPMRDIEDELEEQAGFECLLSKFIEKKTICNWEGDRGVKNLTTVVEALGYQGHQFTYGTPVEEFLSENPGAIESIISWIEENGEGVQDWKDNVESKF